MRWRNEKESDDYLLLPGKPLVEAEGLVLTHGEWLSEEVKAYVGRSVERALARNRRRLSRQRFVAAAFMLLILAAGVAGRRAHVLQSRVLQALRSESYALNEAKDVWRQAKPIVASGEQAIARGTSFNAKIQHFTEVTDQTLQLEEKAIEKLLQQLSAETNRVQTNFVVIQELQADLQTNRNSVAYLRADFSSASTEAAKIDVLHALALDLFAAGTNWVIAKVKPSGSAIRNLIEQITALGTNLSWAKRADFPSLFEPAKPEDSNWIPDAFSGLEPKLEILSRPQQALAEAFRQETTAYESLTNRISQMRLFMQQLNQLSAKLNDRSTILKVAGDMFHQSREQHVLVASDLAAILESVSVVRKLHSEKQEQVAHVKADFDACVRGFYASQARLEEACLKLALFDSSYRRRLEEWTAAEPLKVYNVHTPELRPPKFIEIPRTLYGARKKIVPEQPLTGDKELRLLIAAIYQVARSFEQVELVLEVAGQDLDSLIRGFTESTDRINALTIEAQGVATESRRLGEHARERKLATDRLRDEIAGHEIKIEECLRGMRQATGVIAQNTGELIKSTQRISLFTSVFLNSASPNASRPP